MSAFWRPVATAVSAVGIIALGLTASAPVARAADPVAIGSVNTGSEACQDGRADLYVWTSDASRDAGGEWDLDGSAPVIAGTFAVPAGSSVGRTATVQATCLEGDTYGIFYGGSLVLPYSPTAGNSLTLVPGDTDFGALAVPANVRISGTVDQADGSALPEWDKDGVLLPSDATQRQRYGRYGISGRIEFFAPGADFATAGHLDCDVDSAGAFDCPVPAGVYDLRVYASGFDDRESPSFNYPQTVALTRNYQVTTASGASPLSLRTAPGPAAVMKSAPKVGGTVKVGNAVTAVPGLWNNLGFSATDPAFGYQWLLNGTQVSTAETYTLAPGDANKSLVLRVTVSRPLFDSATAESAAALVAAPDDTRIAPAIKASFGKVKRAKKVSVTVTVTAAGMGALGKIVVAEGSQSLGTKALVTKNHGKVKVTFKAPKTKGQHTLTVTYLGNAQVKGAMVTKVVRLK